MNVPFVTGDKELDAKFVKEAEEAGFENLKGHRTVGGMRASIYNAMPYEGVEALVAFMKKFEEENAVVCIKYTLPESDLSERTQIILRRRLLKNRRFQRRRMRFWSEVHPCMRWNFRTSLEAVARAGAGVNNIPLDKCAEQGIVVFNTPGANANGVKELVLAGMLLAARDIIGGISWVQGEQRQTRDIGKNRRRRRRKHFAGCELKGKKLGIIGLGAIGVLVANAAVNLDMEVYGYDPVHFRRRSLEAFQRHSSYPGS